MKFSAKSLKLQDILKEIHDFQNIKKPCKRKLKSLTREERYLLKEELLKHQHDCMYCHTIFTNDKFLSVEHVRPTSLGGEDSWENLSLACNICNSRRSNKSIIDYYFSKRNQDKISTSIMTSKISRPALCEIAKRSVIENENQKLIIRLGVKQKRMFNRWLLYLGLPGLRKAPIKKTLREVEVQSFSWQDISIYAPSHSATKELIETLKQRLPKYKICSLERFKQLIREALSGSRILESS